MVYKNIWSLGLQKTRLHYNRLRQGIKLFPRLSIFYIFLIWRFLMASFNRVILAGNLTRDIELRETPGGASVADAGLAVNDRRKQGDEWVDETSFVDLTLWGRTAENAAEYLSKGSPILIEGRLKQDSWQNDAGEKRTKLKVVVDRLQFLSNGNGKSEDKKQEPVAAGTSGGKDGDIPF
jgi:single-strand DNA-binding protein